MSKHLTQQSEEAAQEFELALNLGSAEEAFERAEELKGASNYAMFAAERGNILAVIGLIYRSYGNLNEELIRPYLPEIIRHGSLNFANDILKEHDDQFSGPLLRQNLNYAAYHGQIDEIDRLIRSNSNETDRLTKNDLFTSLQDPRRVYCCYNGYPIHIELGPKRTDKEPSDLKVRMEHRLRWLADNGEFLTRAEVFARSGAPSTNLLRLAIQAQSLDSVLGSLEAAGEMLLPSDIKHAFSSVIKRVDSNLQLVPLFDRRIWKGHGARALAFFDKHDDFSQCSDFVAARSAVRALSGEEQASNNRRVLVIHRKQEILVPTIARRQPGVAGKRF